MPAEPKPTQRDTLIAAVIDTVIKFKALGLTPAEAMDATLKLVAGNPDVFKRDK